MGIAPYTLYATTYLKGHVYLKVEQCHGDMAPSANFSAKRVQRRDQRGPFFADFAGGHARARARALGALETLTGAHEMFR